ncbi:MAG: CHAT domain-containing protein [Cyanobacteria bacterium P01_F01_bin.150]
MKQTIFSKYAKTILRFGPFVGWVSDSVTQQNVYGCRTLFQTLFQKVRPWYWFILAVATCSLVVLTEGISESLDYSHSLAQEPVVAESRADFDGGDLGMVSSAHPTGWTSVAGANNSDDDLRLGKQHYDAEQFSEAIAHWQQAADHYEALGQDRERAIAYNYLSIGYQALGSWQYADTSIGQALSLINAETNPFLYAQVLNTEGTLQLQTGQAEAALATWEQAEALYRQQGATDALMRNQINQAQALRVLGYYRRANELLDLVSQGLAEQPDSWLKIKAMQSLGITRRTSGDLQQSQQLLTDALMMAERLTDAHHTAQPIETASLQLSLAKTFIALGNQEEALALLQPLRSKNISPHIAIDAALLELKILTDQNTELDKQEASHSVPVHGLVDPLIEQLQAQPPSRWAIYAQVNLADRLTTLQTHTSAPSANLFNQQPQAIARLLADAIAQAKTLADTQAQSYAIGELGHLYETMGQQDGALTLTQDALTLAQTIQATDMVAKWEWQQGRILKAQGNRRGAIAAYTNAVNNLEVLQQDLVAMNPEVQFSFREQVEPVYRQLMQLLLEDIDTLPADAQQQHLVQTRSVIESLQLAELQNYFRQACLTYQARPIETIDPHAAILYPILLADRLEVIASVPNQPLQHYGIDFPVAEQDTFFETFSWKLHPLNSPTDILPIAQNLYDWMIRPLEPSLKHQSIETLVFVPDGFLRSIPMSILHDGQQYLLENYRVALTPGLQLLNSEPLNPKRLQATTMGLSEARSGFSAIPAVEQELTQVNELVNANSFLNESFTKANVFDQVQATPTEIMHFATHGQFSSSAEDTFLVTWDDRINVKELDQLLRQSESDRPIELLVLSACETASGDNRAALGMAGMAVQSGARSTLATLWKVADASTAELMGTFYKRLAQPGTTRAEALRQAQLSLIEGTKYNHPYYWSPFVLVGNWQ